MAHFFFETLRKRLAERLTPEDRALEVRVGFPRAEETGRQPRGASPLKDGTEYQLTAFVGGKVGQAYVEEPCRYRGRVGDVLSSDLGSQGNRAIFVATLNALLARSIPELGTVHCRGHEPEGCGQEIARRAEATGARIVGLVGYQGEILGELVALFGAQRVRCLDLDEGRVGNFHHGVAVGFGSREQMRELVHECDLVIVTGTSMINGTLTEIQAACEASRTRLVFYGISVAGAARLMGLEHWCFRPV